MNIGRRTFTSLFAIAASLCVASAALANGTLIRWHKMGEEEGGTNNSPVSITLDTPVVVGSIPDFTALDLSGANTPTYRTISGRPDGGAGIGIEFNAAQQEYLIGLALNWPQQSALSEDNGGSYDLAGIDDRSFQFWVRPSAATAQTLVMDTNQHGVRINSSGRFSMRYRGVDYDTTQTVTPNTWYHVALVRPSGAASRSRLYVNGVAVAVSTTQDYQADALTNLTVGANTDGNGEFFSGIIDDLRMYVYGVSDNTSFNYGSFNFATENGFAASPVTGIKGIAGDVNNNGSLDPGDKTDFIAGWMKQRLVNGFQLGDMMSRSQGDLNLDGITDIKDLLILQNALIGAGIGTITAAELFGVPEPSSLLLVLLAAAPAVFRRTRRGR